MARVNKPGFCKVCRQPNHPGEPLSWRGLHIECAVSRMNESNMQISEKRGPFFHHWRERSLAALGVGIFDDPHTER